MSEITGRTIVICATNGSVTIGAATNATVIATHKIGGKCASGTFCDVYELCASNPALIIKVFANMRQFRRTMLSLAALRESDARNHVERVIDSGSFTTFDESARAFRVLPYVIMPKYEVRLKDYLTICVQEHQSGLPALATLAIARQLFSAIKCLQEADVVHGDIKPSNIMLRTVPRFDTMSVTTLDIVLCDFGSSRVARAETHQCAPASVGTIPYIAPEILLGRAYTSAADIWAAMVTVFEVITGDILFDVFDENDLNYGVEMAGIRIAEEESASTHTHGSQMDDDSIDQDVAGDMDFPTIYAHIVLMYRLLGEPPELFCNLFAEYYNNGVPRYTPAILPCSIARHITENYSNLNREQSQQIENFLLLGLRYLESDRESASTILANKFLTGEVARAPKKKRIGA